MRVGDAARGIRSLMCRIAEIERCSVRGGGGGYAGTMGAGWQAPLEQQAAREDEIVASLAARVALRGRGG